MATIFKTNNEIEDNCHILPAANVHMEGQGMGPGSGNTGCTRSLGLSTNERENVQSFYYRVITSYMNYKPTSICLQK